MQTRRWAITSGCLFIALLIGPCLAQQAPSADTASGGVIQGVVRDDTGQGVPGQRLRYSGSASLRGEALTNTEGQFRIEDLPAGRYTLNPVNDGRYANASGADYVLTLARGEHLKDIVIRLARVAVVFGRISNDRGEPQRGLSVHLMRVQYTANGERTIVRTGPTRTTDAEGNYRLASVTPGDYLLQVQRSAESRYPSLPTYYPGVDLAEDSTPIHVAPGADLGRMDITVPPVREPSSIRLRLPPPPTGTSLRFAIRPIGRSRISEALTPWVAGQEQSGGYVLQGIPQGSYELHVTIGASGRSASEAFFDPSVKINVHLKEPAQDLGSIAFPKTRNIRGQLLIRSGPESEILRAGLLLNRVSEPGMAVVPVGSDGAFTVNALADGRYSFRLRLPVSWQLYLSSVRYSGRETIDDGLVIDDDEEGLLEVTIDGPAATLTGIVQDATGASIPHAQIAIVPSLSRSGTSELSLMAIADHEGRFTVQGIRPGDYGIIAWDYRIPDNAEANAEFLSRFQTRKRNVLLAKGGRTEVTLRAISKDE